MQLRASPAAAPTPGAATMAETTAAIDAAAKAKGFACVPVSWEDAQRGTTSMGGLSSYGANISDVRLYEKSGKLLYTLRSENWNERLGYVASKDVAVVVGNHVSGGDQPKPVTLQSFLRNCGEYAGYAGVTTPSLYHAGVDDVCSIRFQTVFLPIADNETVEFCTETYNYNTRANDDPRNLLLLCTAQGTAVQQDGSGKQKIFTHAVDPFGTVHRYWLEAERSSHKVGGAQKETEAEAAAAAARGKATAIHIGTRAMGTRFNVQMLVQVPLKQKTPPPRRSNFGYGGGGAMPCGAVGGAPGAACFGAAAPAPAPCAAQPQSASLDAFSGAARCRREGANKMAKPAVGTSNAARVSRGSEHDTFAGVANKTPSRDANQHATVTVTMYYTVAGGVPSAADVAAAVADLDELYKACPSDKKLVDCTEVTAPLDAAATGSPGAPTTGFLPPTAAQQQPAPAPPTASPAAAPAAAVVACKHGHPLGLFRHVAGWRCDACSAKYPPFAATGAAAVQSARCLACAYDVCCYCTCPALPRPA